MDECLQALERIALAVEKSIQKEEEIIDILKSINEILGGN